MPPEIHLPETFLSMHIALCKEQVMGCTGINMRDTHLVTIDVDRAIQSGQFELPVDLREGSGGNCVGNITFEIIRARCARDYSQDDHPDTNAGQDTTCLFHVTPPV